MPSRPASNCVHGRRKQCRCSHCMSLYKFVRVLNPKMYWTVLLADPPPIRTDDANPGFSGSSFRRINFKVFDVATEFAICATSTVHNPVAYQMRAAAYPYRAAHASLHSTNGAVVGWTWSARLSQHEHQGGQELETSLCVCVCTSGQDPEPDATQLVYSIASTT